VRTLVSLAVLTAAFLAGLFVERLVVERRLRRLKLRVAVTGTRGKSSVTRLVAGALREAGYRVLAKTTGSAARVIFPDGGEAEIPRSGPPSILENKRLIRLARRRRAEALVAEMMSISPECLGVESGMLLRPEYLLLTNVRLDHRPEEGSSRDDIAHSLSRAIRPGCTLLVPDSDCFPVFEGRAAAVGARLIRVPASADTSEEARGPLGRFEFRENVDLALALTGLLGIPRAAALRGMAKAGPDLGRLQAVQAILGRPPAAWTLVSAFAANDPDSSRRVLDRVEDLIPRSRGPLRAVLNLRDDRGDRTRQWLDAVRDGFFAEFESLALVGSWAVPALRRKARSLAGSRGAPGRIQVLSEKSPEKITAAVSTVQPGGPVPPGGLIVGLGNMGGLGLRLRDYWDRLGRQVENGRG
jgi:poly-gamma-glutamate synthase PgsB/CapB